jgi:biotin transporter BioY
LGLPWKAVSDITGRMMNSIVGQPFVAMGPFGVWELVVIACLIGVSVMFVVGVAWLVAKLIKKSSPPPMPEVKEPHD